MATIEELQDEVAKLKAQVNKTAAAAGPAADPVDAEAHRLIVYYSRCAAASGLLSPPVLDLAAVTAVQVRMVKRIAEVYGKDFDNESGRSLVAALSGALAPALIGQGGIKLLVRALGTGFVGGLAAGATIPTLNYGSTQVVGRFFQGHFKKPGNEKADFNELSRAVAAGVS